MRHAIDVFNVEAFGCGRRRPWLIKPAAGCENFALIADDLDVVILHLRERLLAEIPGMHERKMAHIKEVFDGARCRDVYPEGRRVDVASIGLEVFGNGEQFGRRLAERRPHIAVAVEDGQGAARVRYLDRVAVPSNDHDRLAEQAGVARNADWKFVARTDDVPRIKRRRIRSNWFVHNSLNAGWLGWRRSGRHDRSATADMRLTIGPPGSASRRADQAANASRSE